jgi:type IV pilus assembly protein PilE
MHSQNRRLRCRGKSAGGFTLIEVMVVCAVIAILAGVAYPSYQNSILKTKRAEGRAALMQLMQQQERFYSQHNTYIVFSSSSTDANEKRFRWYSGDGAAGSAYEIDGTACPGESIKDCVLLSATPGTIKVNQGFRDPACDKLMLNSTGLKSSSGTATNCWK